jgi:hypothetical protein
MTHIERCSKDGTGLHRRREEAVNTNDLVLEICEVKGLSTSKSSKFHKFILLSMVADEVSG